MAPKNDGDDDDNYDKVDGSEIGKNIENYDDDDYDYNLKIKI